MTWASRAAPSCAAAAGCGAPGWPTASASGAGGDPFPAPSAALAEQHLMQDGKDYGNILRVASNIFVSKVA